MARLLLLLVLLCPALAHADAIAIPDEECPRGSRRQIAGHGGTWCESIACDGCGGSCPEVALCQGPGTHYVEHGHLATSPPPTPEQHVEVYGPCPLIGACERGTCVTEHRCVAEEPRTAPPESSPSTAPTSSAPSSSSCRVGAPSGTFALAMVVFSALMWVRSTRRRPGR